MEQRTTKNNLCFLILDFCVQLLAFIFTRHKVSYVPKESQNGKRERKNQKKCCVQNNIIYNQMPIIVLP